MGEIIRKQDKATLVTQWQRIRLPMQEMRVRPLGWEDLLENEMVTLLQYSCLGYPMDRGAWWATVHVGYKRVRRDLVTKQIRKEIQRLGPEALIPNKYLCVKERSMVQQKRLKKRY